MTYSIKTTICDRCKRPKVEWEYMLDHEPTWVGDQPEFHTTTVTVHYGGILSEALDLCPRCSEKILFYALGARIQDIEKPREYLRKMTQDEIDSVEETIRINKSLVSSASHSEMFDFVESILKKREEAHHETRRV